MCGPDDFIHDFMTTAGERDMVDGPTGQYVYLSVQTVISGIEHPWSSLTHTRHGKGWKPSAPTMAAFRNMMQVTAAALIDEIPAE